MHTKVHAEGHQIQNKMKIEVHSNGRQLPSEVQTGVQHNMRQGPFRTDRGDRGENVVRVFWNGRCHYEIVAVENDHFQRICRTEQRDGYSRRQSIAAGNDQ